jgi:hypothetical protein
MHFARNELEWFTNQACGDWFATPDRFRERLPEASYGLLLSADFAFDCELIFVHPR